MDIRGLGEGLAFSRLLWLLIGSVVLPTMLLSLYGALAIRHHHALLGASLDREVEARLAWAEHGLQAHVQQETLRIVQACSTSGCPDDGPLSQNVAATALPEEDGLEPRETTLQWDAAVEGYQAKFTSQDGLAVSFVMAPQPLARAASEAVQARFGEGVSVTLSPAEAPPSMPFKALPVSAPFVDSLLVLDWPEGSEVVRANQRSSWLAPLGLIALVALVLIGTLVTALAAKRTLRLSRLQTDFVASVSHELRTPLTSIHMFVETLQSGRIEDPHRVDECLELLGAETDRLSRRIERMLNWAKMEADQRIYEREDVAVDQLFQESLDALKSQRLLDPGEDISITLGEPVPLVRVDKDAMVEALLNLLQNAVRYCPPPRTILLSVERKGAMVGLSVEDNGPGISRPHRTRIFDRFYRIDERLSAYDHARKERGSGLGLAIVQAVASAHGGRVELQSESGRGSRFTLWVPATWN